MNTEPIGIDLREDDELWTVKRAAEFCAVSTDKIYRWISTGELPAINQGDGRRAFLKVVKRHVINQQRSRAIVVVKPVRKLSARPKLPVDRWMKQRRQIRDDQA